MRKSDLTFIYQIEYTVLAWLNRLLPCLTHSNRRRIGNLLGYIWRYVFPYRKTLVMKNLYKAFPNKSRRWKRQTVRRCFVHIARVYIDLIATYQLCDERFNQIVNPVDTSLLNEAINEDRGVVLIAFHFGNWEIIADWLARQNYTVAAIAARLVNPLANRLITDIRTRNGLKILPKGKRHSIRTFRYLKNDHLLYMIADQNAGRKGAWVRFFEQWASSFRGPVLFALRKKCPIILTTCLMDRNGRYTIKFDKFSTDTPNSMNEDQKIEYLIQSYTSYFERLIRENPEQYYWVHRRWKTKVPEYLKESGD